MKLFRAVGYYVNWAIYARSFYPQQIQTQNLTHILYAFANVQPETGQVYLSDSWADLQKHYTGDSWNDVGNNVYGNIKQLYLLKKQNRNLKVLLSVGGWTYSSNFAQPASTAQGRSTFANSTLTLLKDIGFDGVDVDWEYPSDANEAQNFVYLLQTLRETLDAYTAKYAPGYKMLISVASPAGPQNYQTLMFGEMDKYIDMWNLMAYDYAGSWDTVSGHQANWVPSSQNNASTPFSTIRPLEDYVKAGVNPAKINVGMPIYGRSFQNTDGPGLPYSGIGEGTWQAGIYDYKDLPLAGAANGFDPNLLASWSYDSKQKIFISYDTPECVQEKAKVIQAQNLGGAMWWELSADRNGTNSLVNKVVSAWGGCSMLEQEENLLSYPNSQYANLKAGFASGS